MVVREEQKMDGGLIAKNVEVEGHFIKYTQRQIDQLKENIIRDSFLIQQRGNNIVQRLKEHLRTPNTNLEFCNSEFLLGTVQELDKACNDLYALKRTMENLGLSEHFKW